MSREFIRSVELGDTAKCSSLYPNSKLIIDSICGHKYGDLTEAKIYREDEVKKEQYGDAKWYNSNFENISHCEQHSCPKVIVVFNEKKANEIICGICPDCGVIVGSRGFITFDHLGCKVELGPTDYDDHTRIKRLRYIYKADEVVKEFYNAVESGDYNLAHNLYPNAKEYNFVKESPLGCLTEISLLEILYNKPSYHCHALYYDDKIFEIDTEELIIVNVSTK